MALTGTLSSGLLQGLSIIIFLEKHRETKFFLICSTTIYNEFLTLRIRFIMSIPIFWLTRASLLLTEKQIGLRSQKLKSWILNETQNNYCRETYATASRFLDMFFMQRQRIARSQFQLLGLACLILAAKIIESRFPPISFEVFDKQRILNLQKVLLGAFKFKINPVTYIQIAEQLFQLWDSYLNPRNQFRAVKYLLDDLNCLIRARTIFQTLDCLDLVTKSLNFNLVDTVFCTFFIEHRKHCLRYSQRRKNKNSPSFIQDTQNTEFQIQYEKIMLQFLSALKNNVSMFSGVKLESRNLLFVMQFSRLNPQFNVVAYKRSRQQTMRQTYNEEISLIAQQVLHRQI